MAEGFLQFENVPSGSVYAPVARFPSSPKSDQDAGKRQHSTGRRTISSNDISICAEEVDGRVPTCAQASRRGDWKEENNR